MGGLILIDTATRNDGYKYRAWTSVLGGKVVTAGCHIWVGEDAVQQARAHCETRTDEPNRAQALRIIDFLAAGYAAHAEDA